MLFKIGVVICFGLILLIFLVFFFDFNFIDVVIGFVNLFLVFNLILGGVIDKKKLIYFLV